MAKPRKRTTKSTTTSTSVSTTTKDTTTKDNSTITPVVPRQTPLKSLNEVQEASVSSTVSEELYIQFAGKEISQADIASRIREAYKESGATASITSLKAYVKPEESKVYYVVNDDITGAIDL